MKKFPVLYKLTSSGQLRQWQVFVKGDSFYVQAGQYDGKLVQSKPTKCLATNIGRANARTPAEQALFEAGAMAQKKRNEGYADTAAEARTNTFIEPMLAHKYDDHGALVASKFPDVYTQPKLDGIRCLSRPTGLWSRKQKPFLSPCLQHIRDEVDFLRTTMPDLVLDGELYGNDLNDDFERICELVKTVKSATPQDIEDGRRLIGYHVYDLPSCNDVFSLRSQQLQRIAAGLKYVHFVQTIQAIDQPALDHWYEYFKDAGYEGQMVRLNLPYEWKRTTSLLKRKEFIDAEYVICGAIEGVGNRKGTVGKFEFVTAGEKPFESNVKGKHPYLRQLWADRAQLIGKTATIRYNSLTKVGKPRFARVVAIRDYE